MEPPEFSREVEQIILEHAPDAEWCKMRQLLDEWMARNPAAPPPVGVVYEGERLGEWCVLNSWHRDTNTLEVWKAASLEQVSQWRWPRRRRDAEWVAMRQLLDEWLLSHRAVPSRAVVYKGEHLGAWCKLNHDHYKHNLLEEWQITSLELHDRWHWSKKPADNWADNCKLLEEFVEEHGRLPQYDEVFKHFRPGSWAIQQRYAYNTQRRGGNSHRLRLNDVRVARLANIPGWTWDARGLDRK